MSNARSIPIIHHSKNSNKFLVRNNKLTTEVWGIGIAQKNALKTIQLELLRSKTKTNGAMAI